MKKQRFNKFKVGQMVWVKEQKTTGKIIAVTRGIPQKFRVEIIKSFDKETQQRTTQLLTLEAKEIATYKPKRKHVNRKSISPNCYYDMVKEFHEAFGHPVADKPTPMGSERAVNRTVWALEELIEFLRATSVSNEEFEDMITLIKAGIDKAVEKSLKDEIITDSTEKLVAQVDALTDASYFLNGSFVEIGITPYKPFKIVQEANMSKLFTDENGNKYVKYREEDGKIMKSPFFIPPEPRLKKEVLRQMEE